MDRIPASHRWPGSQVRFSVFRYSNGRIGFEGRFFSRFSSFLLPQISFHHFFHIISTILTYHPSLWWRVRSDQQAPLPVTDLDEGVSFHFIFEPKISRTPFKMYYILLGGEGWLGFPDLWSGQKPWWNWCLIPVANFGELRRAQLAKSTHLTSSLVLLGSFQIFQGLFRC